MFEDNPELQGIFNRMHLFVAKQQLPANILNTEDYRLVAEFENLMQLLDGLLKEQKDRTVDETQALLNLISHGLIQYQTEQHFELAGQKDFDLDQVVGSKIQRALASFSPEDIPVLRDLLGSMFTAGMNVSEALLAQINQMEYTSKDGDIQPDEEFVSLDSMIESLEQMAQSDEITSSYDVYQQVANQLNQLPPEAGLMMATALLKTSTEYSRDAGLLLLLHPLAKVSASIFPRLVELASMGLLADKDQQRLMLLRNWVNPEQKAIIDKTIKQLQLSQRYPAKEPDKKTKKPTTFKLFDILLSPTDNGGAMALHVIFKKARRYHVLGLILKESVGVKDGFMITDLTQSQFNELIEQATAGMPMRSIKPIQLEPLLNHFLWLNLTHDNSTPAEVLLLNEFMDLNCQAPHCIDMQTVKSVVAACQFEPAEFINEDEFIYGWASPNYLKDHQSEKAIIDSELEPSREMWYTRLKLTCVGFVQSLHDVQFLIDTAVQIKAGKKLNKIEFFKMIAEEVLMEDELPELPPEIDAAMLNELLESGLDSEQLANIFNINSAQLAEDDLLLDEDPDWDDEDENMDLFGLMHEPRARILKWQPENRSPRAVYQIKLSLKGSKPAIWRRLLVMNTITLERLHVIILTAMGWHGGHLYEFTHNRDRFGPASEMPDLELYDDRSVQLRDLLYKQKAKMEYLYDFGESWQHQIQLEKILPAKRKNTPPQLIKAVNACPFEDIGGLYGYYRALKIITQPRHEEYEELREWLGLEQGEVFDPADVDIDGINELLADMT